MALSWLTKRLLGRSIRPTPSRPYRRLSVEALESRLVPTGSTLDLVSVAADGSTGDAAASLGAVASAVSANGQYVVFVSAATDLVSGQVDANGDLDVFLRDRHTDTTILVSRQAGSVTNTGDFDSLDPSISADGQYIVYRSRATDLVSGQLDGTNYDVFLFDLQSGTTTLVSHTNGSATTASNNSNSSARISADGNYVVFVSGATDLLANQSTFDTNGSDDVFLYSRAAGTTVLVSGTSLGGTGNEFADSPSISDDGRYIAYRTGATNVVTDVTDDNGNTDVYLYDRVMDSRVLVSRSNDSATTTAQGESGAPEVSGDGNFVAFVSHAGNVVQDQSDDNISTDVFLYSRASGTNVLVSHVSGAPDTAGDDYADSPSISYDGQYVAYVSASSNLAAGQIDFNFVADVFLYDSLAGESVLVSHNSLDAATTGEAFSTSPVISADGRYVAYTSVASDLVSGAIDTNETFDVFRYDRQTGGTSLISHAEGDEETPAALGAGQPRISANGRVVAFTSDTGGVVIGDDNSLDDVFAWGAPNTAPKPSIVSIGTVRVEGTGITVSGSGSDAEDGAETLSLSWAVYKVGGDTPFATGSGSDFSFTPDDNGSYRIVLTVTDLDGGSASVEQTIAVDNVAPTPSIVSIGAVRVEGTSIAVSGSATDPAGSNDALSYAWEVFANGGATPFATGSGSDFSFTPDDNGSYRIVLTVTDLDGGSASVEQTIAVDNVAPTPSIVSIGAVRVEGTSIAVSGSATDPAGTNDTLSYAWAVYKDGGATPLATGSGADFSFTPDDDGSYRIVLTASDEDGGSASVEQTISVSNVAPSPSIVSVGAVRVEGTSIAVSGSATDPAGSNDALSYAWEVFANGGATPFATGSGSDFSFTPDDGSYRIVLTVSDLDGGSASVEQTIAVDNVAPAQPFYSGASVSGNILTVSGAGVPGGIQSIPIPPGSFAFFTDMNGDGKGDVVVVLPNMVLVVDGATGRFLALFADVNGDGFRDLLVFNLDGTTTMFNGRTGVVVTI